MIDFKNYLQDSIKELYEFIAYRVADKMDTKENQIREERFIAIEEY